MANRKQLAMLKRDVEEWNEWREDQFEITPDLRGANLKAANLQGADLSYAKLSDAKLTEANLYGALLEFADLSGADLSRSILRTADCFQAVMIGADLGGSDLIRVNFRGTHLKAANFYNANIRNSDLSGAFLYDTEFSGMNAGWTVFADIDLRGAKGLERVVHDGPSYIGIDTIYKSGGEIPEAFLLGAGVPDSFITYMKSLAGKAIEFYSCFISYSTKDQEFAERLYADLQANNVRCWFAPHDIQGGKKIHEQIDEAIRLHDKLLLILSPESIKSTWVETEISKARKREVRDERRVLFPVRLVDFETLKSWECFDADTGKDSAREIREIFIPDFSDWKNHDSYQKALKALLRDLKAEAATV